MPDLTTTIQPTLASTPKLTNMSTFTPMAVILTSGTSYTVPAGATTMKAWAVGAGGSTSFFGAAGGAGGCAFKTWSVSGGNTVQYAVGAGVGGNTIGNNSTVTFNGTTITGNGGFAGAGGGSSSPGGGFSGGDGGANGGDGVRDGAGSAGGAVGGNQSFTSCRRMPMTDVSGLKAAVALAGGKTVEDCGASAAFGSGGASGKYVATKAPGYGGGINSGYTPISGSGAVVLYFT